MPTGLTITPAQELLLQAALLPPAPAVPAWERWRDSVDVDSLEPDSQWLLPLLAWNLRRAGIDGRALLRYDNVYRHNWYKNQLLLHAAADLLAALGQEGIQAVLEGAAALAVSVYPDVGTRPIARLELGLPEGCLPRAASLAEDLGWRPDVPAANGRPAFRDGLGRGLVLAPSPAGDGGEPGSGVLTVAIPGATARVPAIEAQLRAVLVAGEHWDPLSCLLWITDAARLIAHLEAGALDAIVADVARERPAITAQVRRLREMPVVIPRSPAL